MKRVLFTLLSLAVFFMAQAQTQTTSDSQNADINRRAKEYAKSKGTAEFEINKPQHILITECEQGYIIEIKGKQDDKNYDIKLTHITKGSSEICTRQTGKVDYNLEEGALFEDADKIVLAKTPEQQTIHVTKDGTSGYQLIIEQNSNEKDVLTVYKETDSSWDFNIPFKSISNNSSRRQHARFSFNLLSDLEFGMGLVSAHSQAAGMDVEFGNAGWEFILNNLFNWEYRPFEKTRMSLGFGVDWRNYRMRGENRFLKENNKLHIAPYPEGADINFSRVKVFSMTLELMLRQNFNRHVAIMAGPIVNFNTHASIKTRYTVGSGKEKEGFKETSSNIHQKPVTVDFKAAFIISPISLYFKYSPVNTLDTDYGPEFKSMSAGVIIEL